jgi:hypothetical protein
MLSRSIFHFVKVNKVKFISILFLITLLFGAGNVRSGLEDEQKKLAQYKAQLEQIKKNIVSIDKSQKRLMRWLTALQVRLTILKRKLRRLRLGSMT